MKRAALLIGLAGLAMAAQAQIYTWKDANGVTQYSDQPPPKGTTGKVVNTKDAAVTAVTPPAAKQGASGAVAASAPAAAAPAPAAAKKDPNGPGCADARKRLDFLKGSKLYKNVANEKGQMEFIDEAKKQEEIRKQNEFLEKNCQ
ncbi:DUF4124 domain-containing protein [Chitinilyticum piscinae]|nr:DUF4124 domain-containing protein [Chitinilyticum piscinae]